MIPEMFTKDANAMRKAGNDLAEAAIRVVNHYDGLHRLSLAISEWMKVIANEGNRDEITAPKKHRCMYCEADIKEGEAIILCENCIK